MKRGRKNEKILQQIKLRKFKTGLTEDYLNRFQGESYLIWYEDNSCEEVNGKYGLIRKLEEGNIKPIRYIFDMIDRITIDRDIKIDIDEISE